MVTYSNTSVILQQVKEHNNITTSQILLWLAIIIAFAVSVGLDCLLIYYEDKVKWIKRELKSLEALIKDYDQLVEKGHTVESRAIHFWDSEDLSGIHLQLSEAENEWVKSTRQVVSEARDCVANYNKHSRGLIHGCTTAIYRLIPIIDVRRQIKTVRSRMTDHIKKKDEDAKDIYKSMERSRSQIRSLLDQYTIEEADKSVAPQILKQKKSSTSIDELREKKKDLFSGMEERWSIYLLITLHAFMKDLSQLQLETETERLWKEEAEKLIADAEKCINNFSWWVSTFSILKKNIPIVTPQFREDMKCIVTAFDGLLERKDKYNFAFIDRAAEKSSIPYVSDENNTITSALKDIHSKLSKRDKSSELVAEMNSMHHDLEKIHKKLRRTEETAGRNACLEQIKSIAEELNKSLAWYLNEEVNNSLEWYVREPELILHEIRNANDRLQKIMKICSIKRQKSTEVVGFKNEVRDLVSKLTSSSDNPLTLSIVGMIGVGKTTLAKAIYYNETVVEHFPIRVWVTVTEGAYYKSPVLLMKKDGTKDQTLHVTKIGDDLKEKLCLVVLDNVSKIEDFDKLSVILSGCRMTTGSRIMLTTRFKNVASHADRSSTPHQIRLLTKEESWDLFQKVTNTERKRLEQNKEKLARKAVGRCGGLPLAILSLGCVISAKGMTLKNLSWVLERINHGHYKAQWLQAWEMNKQELNEAMTHCLYYLTLFPVDFEIPARRLVNLWVAEGLLKQNQQTPEENAERCLEELRDRNMIQVVALKSNAKTKTCRLPSMLREVILRDSDRTSRSQYSGTHLERRFAYRFDDHGLDANSANVFSKKGIPLSIFFFDKREGNKPGEHIGKILSTGIASEKFMEITVLDLEHVFRPQLPETLGKLIHLKYLGLRWTYLEEFPPFIAKLLNLETLDIKHTCIRVLPSSIWKLKKLRNLYLNHKFRSRLEGTLRGNSQENLQTLWGVFMYGSCPLLRDLHRLKNLKKLKLAFQLAEPEKETLAKMIVQLNQLHSLRLRSVDEIGNPKKLILNNMSKLENLSSIQLFGKLEDKLQMSRLPQNLTDLTLSNSKLSEDPMPELQNLPMLKSLCFYADSYTGRFMVCTTGGFLQLQVLRFWNLRDLTDCDVREGAMPNLLEFEARSCRNLAFPTGLKHLKCLRTIKLRDMQHFNQELSNRKNMLPDSIEIDRD